jgi:hypothetical protein
MTGENEIRIVSHSTLFYWWPVWTIGFILGTITLIIGHHMAAVPRGTVVGELTGAADVKVISGDPGKDLAGRSVLIAPNPKVKFQKPDPIIFAPSKNLGVCYAIVLLLVITITNIPLRGLWSVIVIVMIISLSIIFALEDWWEPILRTLGRLDVHINAGGYFFISSVLLIIWLVTLFLFDRQIYMVFTPGQLRVRLEIGEGETAYDTTGMTLQKQRSDLFRHWILGLGSGDLIVRTSGAQAHHFDLPNVLFLGRKVKQIEEMLRAKPVVRAQG